MIFAPAALVAIVIVGQSDEGSREEDMFGSEPAKTSTITTSTAAQEKEKTHLAPEPLIAGGDPFGETTSDREVDKKLGDADDILDIGAFFYLRAQYDALEDVTSYRSPLSSSNLLDVYLDGRPSDRVRAFAQARLNWTPTLDTGKSSSRCSTNCG
jgi:hypothetical protein